jgi:hypothetical protein
MVFDHLVEDDETLRNTLLLTTWFWAWFRGRRHRNVRAGRAACQAGTPDSAI